MQFIGLSNWQIKMDLGKLWLHLVSYPAKMVDAPKMCKKCGEHIAQFRVV